MNRRDFAVLACRLIAVYLLAQSVFFFASLVHAGIAMAFEPDRRAGPTPFLQWSQLAVLALPVVAALLLLRFSESIGARLVPAGEEPAPGAQAPRSWLPFGLVLIGVLELVRSLPELVNAVGYALLIRSEGLQVPLFERFGSAILPSALRVGLGLWLVLGSRGIARMIEGVRGAGLRPDERPWLGEPR